MNIFYLDPNPCSAAQFQCDKHVVKMIVESAQMLCTAHQVLDEVDELLGEKLYKPTHKNHPCSIWVRESHQNYQWLYAHLVALLAEYTKRYGRIHATSRLAPVLHVSPKNIGTGQFVDPPQCMPDEYKTSDTVAAYRDFYSHDKAYFAVWNFTQTPNWFSPIEMEIRP